MLESVITRQHILKYLKTVPNLFAWKIHGGRFGTAGMPDVGVVYRGQSMFFEVKQPGKKATLIQTLRHAELRRAGALVWTVHSVEEVRGCFE